MKLNKRALIRIVCVSLISICFNVLNAQNEVFGGEKTNWHGFTRYDFIMNQQTLSIKAFKAPTGEGDGVSDPPRGYRRCILVVPEKRAPGNPWSWRGCYWNVEPQTEIGLLKQGFCIAYISSSATLKPGKEWDAWYKFLTEKYGLSKKPAFVGMSRGGEFAYMWATNHPDDVSCIYADNPAADNSILMKLGGLAKRDVPLLHVCGSFDGLFSICTLPIENIYKQFGGRISVMIKEGFGHHPHSLTDPAPIVAFIKKSTTPLKVDSPDFAGNQFVRTWYYNSSNSYKYFPNDGAYITCSGPFFTNGYSQYQIQIPGVDAFTTIIAPQKAAPGNPWVFRPDYIKRDAAVDLMLLAKGFYIVKGAVPYNYNGPVLAQWNSIYKYLIGYGFSKKPVMEGNGGAAGEAVGWAIENPDKVSCIYAENPILTSTKSMIDIMPLDSLGPLAKAGIPMLFVCGGSDPSLNKQTLVAKKKYRQLGGNINVLIRAGEGHYLLQDNPAPAFEFITKYVK